MKEVKEEIKKASKMKLSIYFLLRLLIILVMIRQIQIKEWFFAFTCAYTLILFLVPAFIKKKLNIELPSTLESIIYIMIFCAEILGEVRQYYLIVPFWDDMLHVLSGFILAGIGIFQIDLLNKNKYNRFSLTPVYVSIASICFSVTLLVFWEFFEYGSDMILKTDMQKDTIITEINSVDLNDTILNKSYNLKISSLEVNGEDWIKKYGGYLDIGLIDTMNDLIDGVLGAVIFSIFGMIYLKKKDENSFANKFIPKLKQ